jgi:hypothetical protein
LSRAGRSVLTGSVEAGPMAMQLEGERLSSRSNSRGMAGAVGKPYALLNACKLSGFDQTANRFRRIL